MMEVYSRGSYYCNICQRSYTDYNIYLKHCQSTHVKTETESSRHVDYQTTVTNYTEDNGRHHQTTTNSFYDSVKLSPVVVETVCNENYTEGGNLSPVVIETICNENYIDSRNLSPVVVETIYNENYTEGGNLSPVVVETIYNENYTEGGHIGPVVVETICNENFTEGGHLSPESCRSSFIIKCEAEPEDCERSLENETLKDHEVNLRKSKGDNNKLSNELACVKIVKKETTFDVLVCKNSGCQDSDVDYIKTQVFNPGLDFINLNSEGHGTNREEDEAELKTDVSTILIKSDKSLCVELTRIDYLLEDGIFSSSLLLPSDRGSQLPRDRRSQELEMSQGLDRSQGLEEQFEIKIERDEDANFDVPISNMAAETDVISNIKTEDEDGCEPVERLHLENVKTEGEEDLEEIQSKCFICYKKFANRSGMFRHLREVHKGMSKEDWESYCEIKAKEKLMCRTCPVCNKVLSTPQENKRHQLKHVDVKDYQCDVCGELFRQRQTMLNHVFRHSGVKLFQCEHCPITAYTKSRLKVHMQTHTKEKRFECEACSSRFSSREMLKIHIRTHTGEKPFECDVCKKAFTSVTALKVHSTLHTGVKKFQCSVCDKFFSQNIHLKTHARVHTGERPYPCTECDQKFTRKHHLDNHMKKHTGEKPYRCSVCHQRFALKQYLVSHVRVHTGEKPYKCPVCLVGFSQYTEQKNHTKRHLKSDYVTPSRKQNTRRYAQVKNTVSKFIDDVDE